MKEDVIKNSTQDYLPGVYSCDAPVLLIVFNRPITTAATLKAISKVRPKKLYVACDAPRQNNIDDIANVKEVKKIVENISWECKVVYRFREKNLGVGLSPADAVSWLLDHEESGIIIEDDCIASISFFIFCESMLKKYNYDDRIMSISGTNICDSVQYETDYVYTNFPLMWGWATWRRAWKMHDIKMLDWPNIKARRSFSKLPKDKWKFHPVYVEFFDKTYKSTKPNWDHQWIFALWKNRGLTVISSKNLVSNIGFSNNASHTTIDDLGRENLLAHEHFPPYKGPKEVQEDILTDKYISVNWFTATYTYYLKIVLLRFKPILILWNFIKPLVKNKL